MFVESLLIAVAGCAAGLLLGRAGLHFLLSVAPRELPRLNEVTLDTRALLVTIAAGVAASLAAGVAPAWAAARVDVNDALKRHADRLAGGSIARASLVVGQVALAFVLLAATGLLIQTVRGLLAIDAGFDAAHVLTMTPAFLGTRGMTADAMLVEKQAALDAVQAVPGVVAAGMVNDVPLSHTNLFPCAIEGDANSSGTPPPANVLWIDGGYFDALRIPLRRGRLLTRFDTAKAPAAVVSETFARHRFGSGEAIGRRLRLDDGPWLTIVGVVGDVRNEALDLAADDAVYQPLAMNPWHYVRLVVRGTGDPDTLERPIRDSIRRIDPLVPIFHVQPMTEYVTSSLAQRRFALAVMTAFGGLALVLACIGLYGVLGYMVTLRLPELGIRAALGASAADLLRLVVLRGVAMVGSGLLVGAALATVTMKALTSLLFGVHTVDVLTFTTAALVIGTAAMLATANPARRAASVDPVSILRG
jgi:predicted permease